MVHSIRPPDLQHRPPDLQHINGNAHIFRATAGNRLACTASRYPPSQGARTPTCIYPSPCSPCSASRCASFSRQIRHMLFPRSNVGKEEAAEEEAAEAVLADFVKLVDLELQANQWRRQSWLLPWTRPYFGHRSSTALVAMPVLLLMAFRICTELQCIGFGVCCFWYLVLESVRSALIWSRVGFCFAQYASFDVVQLLSHSPCNVV